MGKHIRNGIVYGGVVNEADKTFMENGNTVEEEIEGIKKFKSGDTYTFNALLLAGIIGGGTGATALFSIPLPKNPKGLTPTLSLTNFHLTEGWTDFTPASTSIYGQYDEAVNENFISFRANFSQSIGTNNTSHTFRISGSITFN